jgi:hypothetical protein
VDEFQRAASGEFPEPESMSPVRKQEAAWNGFFFSGAVDGKEKPMNRVAVVAITSISLWVGSLVDQEKLEYLIAGALFTLAMELVVKIITAMARRIVRPKVHSV